MEKQVITGKCPSKSNSYKIVTVRGHAQLAKTPALRKYEKDFFMQCGLRGRDITGLFEIDLRVFYENNRPDLDNCLKIILDCLQQCKAIRNDRQCVKITAQKFVSKTDPRIEFTITEVLKG